MVLENDRIMMLEMILNFGCVKRKTAFEHEQNARIQIFLLMRKLSSGPLLSI